MLGVGGGGVTSTRRIQARNNTFHNGCDVLELCEITERGVYQKGFYLAERPGHLIESLQKNKHEQKKRNWTPRGWNNADESDGWGGYDNYMSAKRRKLNEQFYKDSKSHHSQIFAGVIIYVNGFTNPSSDELRRLMQEHGGRYELYLRKTIVTHVIASNLPNSKFKLAKTMPVVKPEWITDSVKAGQRLSHFPYLLLGNQSQIQPCLQKEIYNKSPQKSTMADSEKMSNFKQKVFDTNCKKQLADDESNSYTKCSVISEDSLHLNERVKSYVTDEHKIASIENKLSTDNKDGSDNEIISNSEEESETTGLCNKIMTTVPAEKIGKTKFHVFSFDKNKKSASIGKSHQLLEIESRNCDTPVSESLSVRENLHLNASSVIAISDQISSRSHSQNNIYNEKLQLDKKLNMFPPKSIHSTNEMPVTNISDNCQPESGSENLPDSITASKSSTSALVRSSSKPPMSKTFEKNFLSEFYSNSRLHHISKWGAELKSYVSHIQQTDSSFPGREKLKQTHIDNLIQLGLSQTPLIINERVSERTVMHIDMDSFFVSVGLLTRPELRGHPVAVTHSRGVGTQLNTDTYLEWEKSQWLKKEQKPLKQAIYSKCKQTTNVSEIEPKEDNTSSEVCISDCTKRDNKTFYSMAEIASCSYEARKAGVKNGMFMGQAMRLCPDLKPIQYDFEAYKRVSRILYDVVASYTHDIEAVSCDEMFIDATEILTDTGATALEFASVLRTEMMDKTGCPASVGIGPNILLAKLATRKAKPNGQYKVELKDAKGFIQEFSVRDLPGVGYSLSNKLAKLGISKCSQLQDLSAHTLRQEFGPKIGQLLHKFSLGDDDRSIESNKLRKSVSAEVNYGIRFTKELELVNFFQELAEEVKKRMDDIEVKGRCITLKLMVRRPDAPKETAKYMGHGICNTLNKSSNLPISTNDADVIVKEVISLYRSLHILVTDLRGIGIQINKLEKIENHRHSDIHRHQTTLSFATKDPIASSLATPETCASVSLPAINSNASSGQTVSINKQFTVIRSPRLSSICHTPAPEGSHLVHSGSISQHSNAFSVSVMNKDARNYEHQSNLIEVDSCSNKAGADALFLLSESQLDSEVLQELPPDIAEEILHDVRHLKKNVQAINSPMKSDVLEDTLPPESQVDIGCLNALPLSLQNELKNYYAGRKKTAVKIPSTNDSPVKGQNKGPKYSEDHAKNLSAVGKYSTSTKHENEMATNQETLVISLCNASHLDDVRKLLKEWWESTPEPQAEDVETVAEYFIKLIQFEHLEQAYCLLKSLDRNRAKMKSPLWKECLRKLELTVQEMVGKPNYRAPFKVVIYLISL
ncbi:deoxycytidyl transferase [Bulinus truncatus]|nr:deoxycytidyl transferase [Bulinus truncatus]